MYFHRMYLLKAIMGCITHKIQNKQPFLDIKEVKPIIYCFFSKKTASFFLKKVFVFCSIIKDWLFCLLFLRII